MSAVRLAAITLSPPSRFCTAAVAIVVRGQSVFAAMPSRANSAARPRVTIVIPNFARVYPVCAPSHFGEGLSGGESERMCGFSASFRIGTAARDSMNVPRTLTSCIRSYFLALSSSDRERSITLALLMTMSMPPNSPCVRSTASVMSSSSRTSPTIGSA
ncbi:hypothetical protein SRABI76_02905 [Microbacterium oxydans]|nr:hypothetical protein SRABI76_02905 [Microbacterium oxydans]